MAENRVYSEKEIMGILNDFYLFQQTYDTNVVESGRLTESMTIKEWRKRCDLKNGESILTAYSKLFGVKLNDITELTELFHKESEITLGEFANKFSIYAERKVDRNSGAAFYNYLSSKVGFQVNSSSTITEVIDKDGSKIVEAITLQYPGFIRAINETSSKRGNYFMIVALLVFMVGVCGLMMLDVPFLFGSLTVIGLLLLLIKSKLFPTVVQINKVSTLGDLIEDINK